MTEQPQESISVITEMKDEPQDGAGWHFIAALGWGTLVGTLSIFVIALEWSLRMMPSGDALLATVVSAFIVAPIVCVFTLVGMIVLGLPASFALAALDRESTALYSMLGSVAGFFGLLLVFFEPERDALGQLAFPALGALAGLAAGFRWGRWRQEVAEAKREAQRSAGARKRDNPIHDLIH